MVNIHTTNWLIARLNFKLLKEPRLKSCWQFFFSIKMANYSWRDSALHSHCTLTRFKAGSHWRSSRQPFHLKQNLSEQETLLCVSCEWGMCGRWSDTLKDPEWCCALIYCDQACWDAFILPEVTQTLQVIERACGQRWIQAFHTE